MVFQDPYSSLNPRMTVGDCLAEALTRPPHAAAGRGSEARIARAARPRPPAGAMPPRATRTNSPAASASASASPARSRSSPRCLIADELVSALDVSVQAQIVNLLLELQDRLGLTVLFIAHDLRLVRHISHRVAVMYLGQIVEIGPTEALFAAPRHPYTRALAGTPCRGSSPAARTAAARRARASCRARSRRRRGCPFHPRCPMAEPICREQVPALEPRGGRWPSACHFADAVSGNPSLPRTQTAS